ncbi:MAG: hypothetical protein ACI81P_002967 [Neolewinella sp.]|jgi:hypothetical protein
MVGVLLYTALRFISYSAVFHFIDVGEVSPKVETRLCRKQAGSEQKDESKRILEDDAVV